MKVSASVKTICRNCKI
ncbi:MAG: 50S ribosomal protein L36, partial [Limnohabitans sp.]|nr:50S ribosomal protein L36 [Limnohabitans sp.]